MSGTASSGLVTFGSGEWFRRVGVVSSKLGTSRFQEALVDLFGCLVSHDARWIIRFSDIAAPEVMHTSGAPEPLVEHYKAICELDPFAVHWRLYRETGVHTLSQFSEKVAGVDVALSRRAFRQIFNVSDELVLFLSTIGQSSIALFLDRKTGCFDAEEIDLARRAFPLLNGLQRAHIGRVFDRIRFSGTTAEIEGLGVRPTLVQDRHGVEIFATASWSAAVSDHPEILSRLLRMGSEQSAVVGDFLISIETFDKYFPLAPGGRMLTLTARPRDDDQEEAFDKRERLLALLTPREKDVFNLMMSGASTSTISKLLSLTKGTVKNYKLRIYRKSGADSERALIQQYAERMSVEKDA